MKNHLTHNRIVNSILIKKDKIKKIIIVEGSHDQLFFSKFKDDDSTLELAFGWSNVINVVKELSNQNFNKCIGIIDTDLKPIIPENYTIPQNVFSTDCHDINIETIEYSFDIIYNHYSSNDKDEKFKKDNNLQNIKEYTYQLSKPLSFLRVLSKRKKYNLCFKSKEEDGNSLDFSKFINKDNYKFISIDKLVDTVINYSRSRIKEVLPKKEVIIQELNELIQNEENNYDYRKLTNGHDFGEIILLGLKKVLGNNQHIKADNILKDCVLNYEFSEFKKTNLYTNIKRYQKANNENYLKN